MNSLYRKYKDKSQKGIDLSLTDACKEGDLEAIKFLLTSPDLSFNANINESDSDPIFNACDYDQMKVIDYLLTSDELNEHADKYFALKFCCEQDKIDIVKYLLKTPILEIDIHHENDMAFNLALSRRSNNVLQFLIFDMNIKRTTTIDKLLVDYKRDEIKNWFELREVNKELNNELGNINLDKKKIKL